MGKQDPVILIYGHGLKFSILTFDNIIQATLALEKVQTSKYSKYQRIGFQKLLKTF